MSSIMMVLMNRVSDRFPDALPGVLKKTRPVDLGLAVSQWEAYRLAIKNHCKAPVVLLHCNEKEPDGRYVEDSGRWLTKDLFLRFPMGNRQRKAEPHAVWERLQDMFLFETLNVIEPFEGDGGDTVILRKRKLLFVGVSTRSSLLFADEIERQIQPRGYKVVRAEVPSEFLHIITGLTAISDDTVVAHPLMTEAIKAAEGLGLQVIQTDPTEMDAANVFEANGCLIGNADCPRSLEILEKAGFEAYPVFNGESAQKNGSFTCDTMCVPY